jgi:hypothetical protein
VLPVFLNRKPDTLLHCYEVEGGNHFIANTPEVENERLRPNIDVHELVGGMTVA